MYNCSICMYLLIMIIIIIIITNVKEIFEQILLSFMNDGQNNKNDYKEERFVEKFRSTTQNTFVFE